MQIDTVNIHITQGTSPIVKAPLESILLRPVADDPTPPQPGAEPAVAAAHPPKIGEPWPGIDGIYAGVSRGEDDQPDGHIVLLNALPASNLNWSAAVKWAKSLGNGARLPTRFESALLYANLHDKLETANWHWTGTQSSESYAWTQGFGHGSQGASVKSCEARARAVSRLPL